MSDERRVVFEARWAALELGYRQAPEEGLAFFLSVVRGEWGRVARGRTRRAYVKALKSLSALQRWEELETLARECLQRYPDIEDAALLLQKAIGYRTGNHAEPDAAIAVLALAKTASQSVYRSLRWRLSETARVFHSHEVDKRAPLFPSDEADPAVVQDWVRRVRTKTDLLRSLVDVRIPKTVVTVQRDQRSRIYSELFYFNLDRIQPLYDAASKSFPDRAALAGAVARQFEASLTAPARFYLRTFAPLGIAREAVEQPFSITRIRPDLDVVSLRFSHLQEDFAALCDHLGAPGLSLLHENPTLDPNGDGRTMYDAFKRDFLIPDETLQQAARDMEDIYAAGK